MLQSLWVFWCNNQMFCRVITNPHSNVLYCCTNPTLPQITLPWSLLWWQLFLWWPQFGFVAFVAVRKCVINTRKLYSRFKNVLLTHLYSSTIINTRKLYLASTWVQISYSNHCTGKCVTNTRKLYSAETIIGPWVMTWVLGGYRDQ